MVLYPNRALNGPPLTPMSHPSGPKCDSHGIRKVLFVFPSFVNVSLEPGDDGYKGTERSAVYMLRELHRRGVDLHVIAPAGSVVPGKLHASCSNPLWDFSDPLDPRCATSETEQEALSQTIRLMEAVVEEEMPDIVDCHIPHKEQMDTALERLPVPHLVNWHGSTRDRPEHQAVADKNPDLPVITVSELQQKYMRANFVAAIPNGLPENVVKFQPGCERTKLAMLARLSPHKDIPRGIQIAKLAGDKLVVGGLLSDYQSVKYYEKVLVPLLSQDMATVSVRGDVTERNKSEFFADKKVLLALTKREADQYGPVYVEADGIHISEALAAGVPVICDSGVDPAKVPPEVGFRCETVAEAVAALKKIHTIEPKACRRHFLQHYSVGKTVERRLQVYAEVKEMFLERFLKRVDALLEAFKAMDRESEERASPT
ncbi:hypothetical protein F4780DRAFT_766709 [Xylariomycetidae sp. FL0641]|nr:hypothetical protein F4780DRAFT_766709 [Xylariomycetidae sp. FL0641]